MDKKNGQKKWTKTSRWNLCYLGGKEAVARGQKELTLRSSVRQARHNVWRRIFGYYTGHSNAISSSYSWWISCWYGRSGCWRKWNVFGEKANLPVVAIGCRGARHVTCDVELVTCLTATRSVDGVIMRTRPEKKSSRWCFSKSDLQQNDQLLDDHELIRGLGTGTAWEAQFSFSIVTHHADQRKGISWNV